jgi:hypothetical protein
LNSLVSQSGHVPYKPYFSVICSVADPEPGSDAFFVLYGPLDPGLEMGEKSGSRMNILDNISESLVTIFGVKII